MGNTSVSSSRVVTLTKTPICSHANCKNRVAFGNIYCNLHDINPMRTGKPKTEEKKAEPEKDCCMMWCYSWIA